MMMMTMMIIVAAHLWWPFQIWSNHYHTFAYDRYNNNNDSDDHDDDDDRMTFPIETKQKCTFCMAQNIANGPAIQQF